MELAITKYLKEHGLEKTLADFKLKHKDYPHKVLLKYDSIESNFTNEEVRDARGLVVEKDTWRVMSIAFRKFFNLGEGHAAPINWESARIFKKMDGTMIHVYTDYVTGEVCFGTTGTANGEGDVDNFHYTKLGGTFSDLFVHAFMETVKREDDDVRMMEHCDLRTEWVKALFKKYDGYTLAFELCTKYNIVVTPHQDSAVYLLGARKLDTLEEVSFVDLEIISKDLGVPMAPTLALNSSPDKLKESFDGMTYREEGYVVCDYGKHTEFGYPRVKMKNPAYCAIHFFKDSTAFWRLIDIVRSGEDNVNEYKATFPGRGEEIEHLQEGWKRTLKEIDKLTSEISTYEEFIEYRKHKDAITFESRGLRADVLAKLGLTHVKDIAEIDTVDFEKLGFTRDEISSIRECASDRGDETATNLRKKLAAKVMRFVVERKLKKHQGFFFDFIGGPKSSKRYMMDFDGKELYNDLIKGYNVIV